MSGPAPHPPQPNGEPAGPGAEPAEPNDEPAGPDAEPAEPNGEPAEPNDEPAGPDAEPAEPKPAPPEATPGTPFLLSRRGVVVLLAAAGGILLLSAGRPWVSAVLAQVPGRPEVSASGRVAAPGAVALGFVALAGAVVVATAGRLIIRITAAVLALAGAGASAAAVLAVSDPARAVAEAATRASGVSDAVVSGAARTIWPYLAALAGALVLVAGGIALREAKAWTAPRRFERPTLATGPAGDGPGQPEATSPREDPLDAWDALSRGEDPT